MLDWHWPIEREHPFLTIEKSTDDFCARTRTSKNFMIPHPEILREKYKDVMEDEAIWKLSRWCEPNLTEPIDREKPMMLKELQDPETRMDAKSGSIEIRCPQCGKPALCSPSTRVR